MMRLANTKYIKTFDRDFIVYVLFIRYSLISKNILPIICRNKCNVGIYFMHKVYLLSLMSTLILLSCAERKESKQYMGNIIAENTNTVNIDIKSRDFDAISLIKNSSFTSYPNIKIEDLISSFNSVEWQDFIAEDDYMRYIDMIGKYDTNEYIIQFKLLDHYRWELYAFEINKTAHSIDEVSSSLYTIYTNHK